jgi:hypothetical protein
MAWGLDASWILGSDIFFLKDANNQDLHGAWFSFARLRIVGPLESWSIGYKLASYCSSENGSCQNEYMPCGTSFVMVQIPSQSHSFLFLITQYN